VIKMVFYQGTYSKTTVSTIEISEKRGKMNSCHL